MTPPDPIDAIRRLYFAATRQTISRDVSRAVQILTTIASEDERQRAAVFMDGLSQMRSEWGARPAGASSPRRPRGGSRSEVPRARR